MNKLQSGKNYNTASCYDNYGIIGSIPLGLGVVHRRKESHDDISRLPQYKIGLSLLEINGLDIGASIC